MGVEVVVQVGQLLGQHLGVPRGQGREGDLGLEGEHGDGALGRGQLGEPGQVAPVVLASAGSGPAGRRATGSPRAARRTSSGRSSSQSSPGPNHGSTRGRGGGACPSAVEGAVAPVTTAPPRTTVPSRAASARRPTPVSRRSGGTRASSGCGPRPARSRPRRRRRPPARGRVRTSASSSGIVTAPRSMAAGSPLSEQHRLDPVADPASAPP